MLYIVAMKQICTKCNIEQELKNFARHYKKTKDGFPVGIWDNAHCAAPAMDARSASHEAQV